MRWYLTVSRICIGNISTNSWRSGYISQAADNLRMETSLGDMATTLAMIAESANLAPHLAAMSLRSLTLAREILARSGRSRDIHGALNNHEDMPNIAYNEPHMESQIPMYKTTRFRRRRQRGEEAGPSGIAQMNEPVEPCVQNEQAQSPSLGNLGYLVDLLHTLGGSGFDGTPDSNQYINAPNRPERPDQHYYDISQRCSLYMPNIDSQDDTQRDQDDED